MYAEVAVNVAGLRGTFHYHLPNHLSADDLQPGHLVTVPLRQRRAQGIVVNLSNSSPVPSQKPNPSRT